MKTWLLMIALTGLYACSGASTNSDTSQSSSKKSSSTSLNDNVYGYSEKNPILLGGGTSSFAGGSAKERQFLDTLTGPKGEKVSYRRLESCCFFNTPNGYNNGALLEKYEVTYAGLTQPIILYLNTFDSGVKKPLKGLKFK